MSDDLNTAGRALLEDWQKTGMWVGDDPSAVMADRILAVQREAAAEAEARVPCLLAIEEAARVLDAAIASEGPLIDSIGAESGWDYKPLYPNVREALDALRAALKEQPEA